MKIKLSPVRMDETLVALVNGDVLTVNGDVLDFSNLPESCVLPYDSINNKWVFGNVCRLNGEIILTLILPHGANAPHETRFPIAYDAPMTVVDGPVQLPPYDTPPEVESMPLPEQLDPEVAP